LQLTESAQGVARGPFARLLEWYCALARRERIACLLVALVALGGRAAMLPHWHVPMAGVHDEFSYLLAGDTYASGRLTNPPHPMWEHFETFHVLQQPTYMSKYPPLQGLVLAFGQRVFGEPWIGVWLSVGLMCAAICWMLQGWIAPPWALLGGLMVAVRIGLVTYWMNSYWGGAIAALGGALVLGAAPRIARSRRVQDAIVFAVGLAILMNSRPFEGVVLTALATVALCFWLPLRVLVRLLVPAGAVLLVTVLLMGYYNKRVTGDALLFPYVAHDRQYAAESLFLWNTEHVTHEYRHAVLREYWAEWQPQMMREVRKNLPSEFFTRLGTLYGFYFELWPVLAVVLIWPFRLANREERWTALILVLFLGLTVAPVGGILPHYSAPIAALLYLRLLQALSRLPSLRIAGKPIGAIVLAGLLTAWMVKSGTLLMQPEQEPKVGWERAGVVQQLERTPGNHLVIVHYGPKHSVHDEWVYNRADIDASRIVWAREMGKEADAKLVQYFNGRQVWTLDADEVKLSALSNQPSAPNAER